jgi:glycosyltransferase involved in cell wall biosynthesis
MQPANPPPKPAKSRRALFIVITDYPGGAERVTFSLAAELATRPDWDVEVKIVCSKLPDSFSERVLPPSVRVSYGPTRSWFAAFPLLPFRLMFRRYDLVFTTHVYTNGLLSLLRRARLVRIGRLVVRESTSPFDRFSGARASRFRFLYGTYGAEDLLIAQTGYMADHVRPWLPPRSAAHLHVLANPVSTTTIESAAARPLEPALRQCLNGHRNVLFCGRLIDCKQPEIALEAFRIGLSDDRSAQLVFIGAGPLEPGLRKQATEAGLADRVHFLGFRSDPFPIMAACQYGLVTSSKEGFPNVVVEMMACGLRKVIVTPCAGDLDQLPGITVTDGFAEQEIADALKVAVEGENCSELYRQFAATRSVSAYLDAVLRLA